MLPVIGLRIIGITPRNKVSPHYQCRNKIATRIPPALHASGGFESNVRTSCIAIASCSGRCHRSLVRHMQDPSAVILIVAFTFLLAGMVKGVIGMGLPTVAMGLLGLVMRPVEAAALLVVPSLVTNVWQLVAGRSFIALLRRFATLMVGVCLGTAVGIALLTGGSATSATVALGAVLAAYGAIGLISARFTVSPRFERWLSPLIGLITGFLTGATGVFVIPAVPYFNSLGLAKEELIQTLGLSFTVSTLALALGLMASGQFQVSVASSSLLALLPALGGMLLGQGVRNRLKPEVFRRWFFVGLLVLGVYMVLRALSRA